MLDQTVESWNRSISVGSGVGPGKEGGGRVSVFGEGYVKISPLHTGGSVADIGGSSPRTADDHDCTTSMISIARQSYSAHAHRQTVAGKRRRTTGRRENARRKHGAHHEPTA